MNINSPVEEMLQEGIKKAKDAYDALDVPGDDLYSAPSENRETARRGILADEIGETLKTLNMKERTKTVDENLPWIGAFEKFRMNTEEKSICLYCNWLPTYVETGVLPCMVSCPFAFNGMELKPRILKSMVNGESLDSSLLTDFEQIFLAD